jgi:hypothetical protein
MSGSSLTYSPGSTPQGLAYSPYGNQGDNSSSLLSMLLSAAGGSGSRGGGGLSSYSGDAPYSGLLSAGGAGYSPNSGGTSSSAGTQYAGLGNTLMSNAQSAGSLYNIGNLASKGLTGTGLTTGVGNLLAGYDWSGMATGAGLDALSAQAASDISAGTVAGGLTAGTAATAAGAAGLGSSALAALSATDLATLSAAIPGLAGTFGGLSSLAAAAPLAAL